jgi:hypothetical protein
MKKKERRLIDFMDFLMGILVVILGFIIATQNINFVIKFIGIQTIGFVIMLVGIYVLLGWVKKSYFNGLRNRD